MSVTRHKYRSSLKDHNGRCFAAELVANDTRPLPLPQRAEAVLRMVFAEIRKRARMELDWNDWVFAHRVCNLCVERDRCADFKAEMMRVAREVVSEE